MSNREIYKWAWEKSRDNRWPLWAGTAVSLVPLLWGAVVVLVTGRELLSVWKGLLAYLSQMLGFGVMFIAFELALERESELGHLSAPFRREIWKQAAVVDLLFLAVSLLLRWYPDSLVQRGKEIMAQANDRIVRENITLIDSEASRDYLRGERLAALGRWLSLGAGLSVMAVFLPAQYLLFFRKGKPVAEMLREGLGIAGRSLGRLLRVTARFFLFFAWIYALWFPGTDPDWTDMVWVVLFLLVMSALYLPCGLLSWARLTVELVEGRPEAA